MTINGHEAQAGSEQLQWCQSFRIYRRLSPSIAPKRNYLAVDLTVSLAHREEKSRKIQVLTGAGDN
jgi:hypothetical protein